MYWSSDVCSSDLEKICLPCPERRLPTHLPNYRRSDAGDFRWSKFNFRFSLGTRIMLPSQTDNSEETAQMKMHSTDRRNFLGLMAAGATAVVGAPVSARQVRSKFPPDVGSDRKSTRLNSSH